MSSQYCPISDYAIVGNLRSAILISKEGSIDWAPAPFIDSSSVFGSLLDAHKGGSWSIRPLTSFTSRQYYIEKTNILVTEFTTESGVLRLTDFLPVEEDGTYLPPEKDITFKVKRKVECVAGSCALRMVFNPQFDFARGYTKLSTHPQGVYAENGNRKGLLVSSGEYTLSDEGAITTVNLSTNEARFFVFRYNRGEIEPEKDKFQHHEEELQKNITYWRLWTDRCDFEKCLPIGGVWREVIVRSLLVLKVLFFEPVGTVAAAPTTSLPEEIGGVRNWDYRFTWLRDSAFVFKAFFQLGHTEEAEQYLKWLVKKCRHANPEDIRALYSLRDEVVPPEHILSHLEGYEESKPVRIGNDAYKQRQLDIYGNVLDMVWRLFALKGGQVIDTETWEELAKIADYVAAIWEEPDEGLWEVRSGAGHFVYSKVMCWVALDRACRLRKALHFEEGNPRLWEKEAERIQAAVRERGWSEKKHSFVQKFDTHELDASLLLLSKVGFIAGDDPRMLATIDAIQKELCTDKTFLYRYTAPDGLPGREGAFLVASFWLVDALALAGRKNEARQLFERILSHANHVGLFSEEIDPQTKSFLGNFPQAYTHVGLINSALLLSEVEVA